MRSEQWVTVTGSLSKHILVSRGRQVIDRETVVEGLDMPADKRIVRVACDLPEADLLDPDVHLFVQHELSVDGGKTWWPWGGFRFDGTPGRALRPWHSAGGTQPWVRVKLSGNDRIPVGVQTRTRMIPLGKALTAGLIVEAE
jgi:hypothetical protein